MSSLKTSSYVHVILSYINVRSLTQSMCLTIKWHSGGELVDRKVASEAKNVLNAPRPRPKPPLIWTSKHPNGESRSGKVHYLLCFFKALYYAQTCSYVPTPHYA